MQSDKVILLSLLMLLNCASAATAEDAFENNLRRQTSIAEPGKSANAWEPYVENLEKRIKQVWKPQTVGEPTGCMLNLMLNPNGSIRKAGVQNTSNNPEFDQAALEAMKAAAPFPPLFDKSLDRLHLHISFRSTSIGNVCKAFIFLPGDYEETQHKLALRNALATEFAERVESSQVVNPRSEEEIQAEKRRYQFWLVDTQRRVTEAWLPPRKALPIKIMFEVKRDGTLLQAQPRTPSDDETTRKAVAAIRSAAPFKLPRGAEERAVFEFNFDRKLLESGNAITIFSPLSNTPLYITPLGEPIAQQSQDIIEFYKAMVQWKIKRAWFLHEDFGERKIVLNFKINSDGSIEDLKIHRSSNLKFADQLALTTVRGSAPFPPLPVGAPASIDLSITLETTVLTETGNYDNETKN